MVERIFSEKALSACFIESDETHDRLAGRRGLRESDGLLVRDAARPGINGNVRQAEPFDAAFITDTEIDSLYPA